MRRRTTNAISAGPMSSKAQVLGSGIGEICRFRSPVLVPAVARDTVVPIVSEYGFAVGEKAPVALPENELVVSG